MIRIDGPLPIRPPASAGPAPAPAAATSATPAFGEILGQLLNQAQSAQQEANQAALALASGGLQDISQVVIASEKASLALELLVEVRNKVLEAYQEVMRTPI